MLKIIITVGFFLKYRLLKWFPQKTNHKQKKYFTHKMKGAFHALIWDTLCEKMRTFETVDFQK